MMLCVRDTEPKMTIIPAKYLNSEVSTIVVKIIPRARQLDSNSDDAIRNIKGNGNQLQVASN